MKIVVAGTRGIPGIQGGVETHCQQLYPRIAALGHDVTVLRRSCYIAGSDRQSVSLENGVPTYKGVKLKDVYAPRRKSLEAIVHTFLAVLRARAMHPDILHIHAIGPSLMVPLARLLGMRVVTTNHGPDYDRGKWGRMAKWVLKTGEKWGARRSNKVIVISRVIADILANNYGRTDTELIFNGVPSPIRIPTTDYITSLGLEPGRYAVALARFVPEKNFHLLIRAWQRAGLTERGFKLVLAGDADHEDEYSRSLKALAAATPGVVLTGFIKGAPLQELMTHARLFTLPSSHEGLPISLLEAMSYGLDVLVSDIPANSIRELAPDDFFHLSIGDDTPSVEALTEALLRKFATATPPARTYDLTPYDWDHIAQQTLGVYAALL